MKLKEGVYENIVNNQLKDDITDSENNGLVCKTDSIDDAESSKLLAQYISDSLCRKLEDSDCSIEEKIVKVKFYFLFFTSFSLFLYLSLISIHLGIFNSTP